LLLEDVASWPFSPRLSHPMRWVLLQQARRDRPVEHGIDELQVPIGLVRLALLNDADRQLVNISPLDLSNVTTLPSGENVLVKPAPTGPYVFRVPPFRL
jgi:hypothetical protein